MKKTGGWGLRKVSESTFNRALLFPFAVTSRRSRDVRINQRIDSPPCPALSSMFPGRLACILHRRGFTKLRRSARPGFTAGWIMREGVVDGRELQREVDERSGNGGGGGT